MVGLGVGYAIGSYFGPERIQRMLTALTDQDSSPTSSVESDEQPDVLQDVAWPSAEFNA
jgi:hypothetical protein